MASLPLIRPNRKILISNRRSPKYPLGNQTLEETYEPPHGKTNNLHMRKQRRRSASR